MYYGYILIQEGFRKTVFEHQRKIDGFEQYFTCLLLQCVWERVWEREREREREWEWERECVCMCVCACVCACVCVCLFYMYLNVYMNVYIHTVCTWHIENGQAYVWYT